MYILCSRSDLINYSHLDPNNHIANLNNAFDAAANELGIPQILDAEGILSICLHAAFFTCCMRSIIFWGGHSHINFLRLVNFCGIGRKGAICEQLRKRMIYVCCLWDVRWRGQNYRIIGMKGRRYKL